MIKVIKSSCCVFVPLSDNVLLSLLVYSDNSARHLESIKKVKELSTKERIETLPKALRTQVLTALTSIFGLVGLVQYDW